MLETRVLMIDELRETTSKIRNFTDSSHADSFEISYSQGNSSQPHSKVLKHLHIDSVDHRADALVKLQKAQSENQSYRLACIDLDDKTGSKALGLIKMIRDIEPDMEVIVCLDTTQEAWQNVGPERISTEKCVFLTKPFAPPVFIQMIDSLSEKITLRDKILHLQASLEKAEAAAKASCQAKQQFLSIIGHELRTPLNVILLTTEELLEHHTDDETLEILKNSHGSTLKLAKTIEDILNYTQLDVTDFNLHKSEFFLRDLFEDLMKSWAHAKVPFQLSITEAVPDRLVGDREKIIHLVHHLLSNAFKFDRKGPIEVCVDVSARSNSKALVMGLLIEVKDRGIGMTPDQLQRAMELFYQADSIVPGSGLGLSYAKKLVDALGGSIRLESQIGLGTLVTIHLPILKAAATPL